MIPRELAQIRDSLEVEIREQGLWRVLTLAAGLLISGYGIQKLFWSGPAAGASR